MQNLTPSPSVDNAFFMLILPANLLADAIGSLAQLGYVETWESYGDETPDAASQSFVQVLHNLPTEYGIILTNDNAALLSKSGKVLIINAS